MTVPEKTKKSPLWHHLFSDDTQKEDGTWKKARTKLLIPKSHWTSWARDGNLTPQGVSPSWTLVAADLSFSTATSCCEMFHRLTTMWRNTLWLWLFNSLETPFWFLFWKQKREPSPSPTHFSHIFRLERLWTIPWRQTFHLSNHSHPSVTIFQFYYTLSQDDRREK